MAAERVDYSSDEEYAQAAAYEMWAYQEWCAKEEARYEGLQREDELSGDSG